MMEVSSARSSPCVRSQSLRQEAGDKLRMTVVTPGFIKTNIADALSHPELKAWISAAMDKMARPLPAPWLLHRTAGRHGRGEIIVHPTARS